MAFGSDTKNRAFDCLNAKIVAETKEGIVRANNRIWRAQTKAIFELAKQTGRKPYFHFEQPQPLEAYLEIYRYEYEYGIKATIDVGKFTQEDQGLYGPEIPDQNVWNSDQSPKASNP